MRAVEYAVAGRAARKTNRRRCVTRRNLRAARRSISKIATWVCETYFTDAVQSSDSIRTELRRATGELDAYAAHRRYFAQGEKTPPRSISCSMSI